MAHANRDQPCCPATWAVSGRPCKHEPWGGTEYCAAHQPDGDKRTPPPPDEKRCTAPSRETGERCRSRRGPNATPVCRRHGGSAPQVIKAAARRAEHEEAKRIVETYGLPIDITPEAAILAEVHRTAGAIAWLESEIRGLTRDDLIWGTTKVVVGGREAGETQEAAPHILLKLYQDERAQLVRVCAAALRAGIEERQVKLAERQGALLVDLIKAILADLRLTPEQKALVPEVVPRHLRALHALALTN